jgi:hypothetical protein
MCLQFWWFQKHGRQKNSTRESGPDPIMPRWNCWWRVKPLHDIRVLFFCSLYCVHLLSFHCSEITWMSSPLCFIFGVEPWQYNSIRPQFYKWLHSLDKRFSSLVLCTPTMPLVGGTIWYVKQWLFVKYTHLLPIVCFEMEQNWVST